jgi:hypothetical protein
MGWVLCNVLMWWYWPEAHGFVVSPWGVAMWGTALGCDLVYPFLLRQVRKTEVVLADGRVVRGPENSGIKIKVGKKQL